MKTMWNWILNKINHALCFRECQWPSTYRNYLQNYQVMIIWKRNKRCMVILINIIVRKKSIHSWLSFRTGHDSYPSSSCYDQRKHQFRRQEWLIFQYFYVFMVYYQFLYLCTFYCSSFYLYIRNTLNDFWIKFTYFPKLKFEFVHLPIPSLFFEILNYIYLLTLNTRYSKDIITLIGRYCIHPLSPLNGR